MPRWGSSPAPTATAVERAYKRLIKQHHPDREGGDAEPRRGDQPRLSRASRRRGAEGRARASTMTSPSESRAAAAGWIVAAGCLAVGHAGRAAGRRADRLTPLVGASPPLRSRQRSSGGRGDPMDQPLNLAADRRGGARGAARFAHAGRDGARRREPRLPPRAADRARASPARPLRGVRRCGGPAAGPRSVAGQGPFSELAVTGRQWSAASALSDDYLAIDGRLDRIRLRVELGARAAVAAGRAGERELQWRCAAAPPNRVARRGSAALPSGFSSAARCRSKAHYLRLSDASNFLA